MKDCVEEIEAWMNNKEEQNVGFLHAFCNVRGGSKMKDAKKLGTSNDIPYRNAPRPNERFYNTTLWRKTSRDVIKRDGCCMICGAVDDLTCDHIEAPHGDGTLEEFCKVSNLQTLCRRCHNAKTAWEVYGRENG
ncbi:MAG: HNH endonuclease signature motif containing protein [Rectinema sp.]